MVAAESRGGDRQAQGHALTASVPPVQPPLDCCCPFRHTAPLYFCTASPPLITHCWPVHLHLHNACVCFLPAAQGLDELLAIMSGGADAASAAASAIDAAAAAAADEAAEAAASGLGDWSSGTSVDVGLPDDVGGGGNGAAPELLMSKVVAARKTVLRASGHVDPLYLLEAVQVGGDASGTERGAVGKGSGAECGDRGLGPASQLSQRKGGCWRVVCSWAVAWGSREQDKWWCGD